MPESLNEVRPTVVRPLINRGLDILSRVLNITPTLRANEDQLKSLERKCNSLRTMLQQYAPQLFEPGSDVNAVNSGHAQPLDLDGLVAVEESVLEDLNKVEQAVTRLQGLGRAPRLLALSETNLENAQSRLNNASSQLLMSLLLQKLLYYPQNQQRIARNQTQFLSELQEVVDNVVEANDTPRMLDCLNYIQIALKRWGTDGTYRKPSIQSIRDWQVKGAGFSVVAETTKPRTNIERMGLLTRSMSASSASTTSALSVVAGRRSFSDNIGDTVHSPSSSSSWRPSTRPAAAGRSEVLREPLSEQRTGQGPAVITKSPQYISERWGSAPPRNRFTHHTNGMPKNVTLPFKFRESAKLDELLGYIFHSELDVRIRALVQETLLGTYKMYTTSDVLISAAIRRWNYVKRFGNHVDIPLNFFDQWLKLLQKSQDDRGALEQLAGFLQGLYTTLSDEPLTKQAKDTILLARFARSSAPLAWWTNMPKSNVDFLYLKPDLLADHLTLLANSCHRLIRAPHMLFGLLHEDPTSWVFPLLGSRMLFEKTREWAQQIIDKDTHAPYVATHNLVDIVYRCQDLGNFHTALAIAEALSQALQEGQIPGFEFPRGDGNRKMGDMMTLADGPERYLDVWESRTCFDGPGVPYLEWHLDQLRADFKKLGLRPPSTDNSEPLIDLAKCKEVWDKVKLIETELQRPYIFDETPSYVQYIEARFNISLQSMKHDIEDGGERYNNGMQPMVWPRLR